MIVHQRWKREKEPLRVVGLPKVEGKTTARIAQNNDLRNKVRKMTDSASSGHGAGRNSRENSQSEKTDSVYIGDR